MQAAHWRTAGFSLIEAMVVLVISGMALLLIFTIGTRATETGFRLGRNALSLADRSIYDDNFRALVEGMVLAPQGADPTTFQLTPVRGTATSLEGDAVLALSTRCAPAGPARDLKLAIVPRDGGGTALTCGVGDAPTAVLIESPRPLTLSYSEDGVSWAPTWSNAPDPFAVERTRTAVATRAERRLYVRLAGDDGAIELLGLARSGRSELIFTRDRERIL